MRAREGGGWSGCKAYGALVGSIDAAVVFARQQQEPLSEKALKRNFYCSWEQVWP